MGLCDAHTANCFGHYEATWRYSDELYERKDWNKVMDQVEAWTSDWECFADLDMVSPNEKAQILDFTKRLRAWLDSHSEFFMWKTSNEDLPAEPFLPSQQNTPVYPDDQPANTNEEIPT